MFFTSVKSSHISSGAVALLVGYTGSIAVLFQLFDTLNLSQSQISDWMLALGIGAGVCSIIMSFWARQPLLAAWSTPGAALLAATYAGAPIAEVIGAFILCAALLILTGLSGLMAILSKLIPSSLANGLLAGVLFPFILACFNTLQTEPMLMLAMGASFVVTASWKPQLAIFVSLLFGLVYVAFSNTAVLPEHTSWALERPDFITPSFSLATMIGLGLPLYIVTMCSQNIPGIAVQQSFGYKPPVSMSLIVTGLVTAGLAPFGGFAFNLAAISASICAGPEADTDPNTRYRASVLAGVFYICVGLGGAAVVAIVLALPPALIAIIAGLALLNTFSSSLFQSLQHTKERLPALITFLITISGVSFWDIGAAFWGLLAGLILYHGTNHLRPIPQKT
ncbi:benzoate membrane transport protein [Epibacterium ulvae]|uniref:Benzoate membrane transport protein n=1 Tax=Epibacterium ulvae TaxID=1156985 RepID=A0A1G5R5N0_9RHOB|nr:benzoate/H(+) symporter BenE family transporter [Epibacterium ulvae]SCZ69384.1 benzoate membrane transport protein [Epibacterium ulvae]